MQPARQTNPPQDPSRLFHQPDFIDFFDALGRPTVYYPALAKMIKSVKAAIFLGQLMYWSPRAKNPSGWVYKSVDEWTDEIGMTYHEQRHARRDLLRLRLIEERYDRTEHRLYFRINRKILVDLWTIWAAAYPPTPGTGASAESVDAHLRKAHLASDKSVDGTCGKRSSINRDDHRDDRRDVGKKKKASAPPNFFERKADEKALREVAAMPRVTPEDAEREKQARERNEQESRERIKAQGCSLCSTHDPDHHIGALHGRENFGRALRKPPAA